MDCGDEQNWSCDVKRIGLSTINPPRLVGTISRVMPAGGSRPIFLASSPPKVARSLVD